VNITDVSGLPQGATYTFTATDRTVLAGVPGTTDITLQIRIPPLTQIGTYPILIVFSGGGIIHTIKAQIIVN
jgi:uncharacterized membrane protein